MPSRARRCGGWWSSANRSAFRCNTCCLVDYSNSRGAVDMGLLPDRRAAMALPEMLAGRKIWMCCGWWARIRLRPRRDSLPRSAFVVVQDLFLTETAQAADVVFPAASAYEKNGTVTNVCGEVQRLRKALCSHGRQARPGNHRPAGARNGRSRRAGPVDSRTRCSRRFARTCADTMCRCRCWQRAARRRRLPVNGRVPLDGAPGIDPLRARESVHLGNAGALF